ncbi:MULTISPECIES: class II aldolase/adducin family protein [Bradyrhizobium]|jgi:ribulose-5-phosphate 4-epimerase/fuculose-1-phosphate aldolase|uniref:class II aldolase/adducin family protein n=1 Tax=Bradyrhizobium TaxID=374 RepID=UPI00039EEEAA|nr:class II aldolase/adducin family protein [Bradyrhizobium denitrificans]MCL8488411.1 class II aldolase/adducin family protein [Bradyrhizobium denitrificans]
MTRAIRDHGPDAAPVPSARRARGIDAALHVGRRLTWELPPPQPTVEAERLYRKQRLAAGFRLFARNGFASGIAGHITARDPEWTDHFWVNPLAVPFAHIRASDLLLVNDKGEIVEGDGYLNGAAFAIHSELHKANPRIIAAAHAHSMHGKVWSTLGRLLDPITQDACMFYGDHALFDDYTGVVEELSEGARIASVLGDRKAVILRNHGLLTVGHTVETAVYWFIAMENAAHAQIMAENVGTPRLLSHEVAAHTAARVGSEFVAWLCFQQQWDVVIREEPDLLQ